MTLADVMGRMGLEVFAEVGLVLFAGAFLTVLLTTFWRRNRESFERARFLPLDEEPRTRAAEDPSHE